MAELSPSAEDKIADRIADGIAKGLAILAPRKVTFGRFDPKSPFHPDKNRTPKLKKVCFDNGHQMHVDFLHDEEINLLNKIHRSGRYIERQVEVIVRDEGTQTTLEIRYAHATPDDRFNNTKFFISMQDLLRKVVAEQDALDAEEAAYKRPAAPVAAKP